MADPETSPVTSPAAPVKDAKPPAPPQEKAAAAPESPAETVEGTFADDQFSRQQLVRHARELVGAESYEVEVALRHAGDQDYFTAQEAKAAVKKLLEAPAEEEAA